MPSIVICIKAETVVENFDDVYVIYESTATTRIPTKTVERMKTKWEEAQRERERAKKERHISLLYDDCIAPSNISFEREY